MSLIAPDPTTPAPGACRCESCGAPADGRSLDDVPLCSRCGLQLAAAHARLKIYDNSALDHLGDRAPLCDLCDSLAPYVQGVGSRCAAHRTQEMDAALAAGDFEIIAKLLPGAEVKVGDILTSEPAQ